MDAKTPISLNDDPDMDYLENDEPVIHTNQNNIQHEVVLNPTPVLLSSRSDLSSHNYEKSLGHGSATKELVDSYQIKIQNYLGKG